MKRRYVAFWTIVGLLLGAIVPEMSRAATINVAAATAGVGNDEATDNDGLCGLREAVIAANTNAIVGSCPAGTAGADTVLLPAGTFHLELAGVGPESVNASDGAVGGDLDLLDQTAIQGAGPGQTTIDQDRFVENDLNNPRVIHVPAGAPNGTILSDLSITGGQLEGNGLALGGGIFVESGTPDLSNVQIVNNTIETQGQAGGGAGIAFRTDAAFGTVELTDVTINNNDIVVDVPSSPNGGAQGGGIYFSNLNGSEPPVAVLNRVRIQNNDVNGQNAAGGGAFMSHTTVIRSVIENNSASTTAGSDSGFFSGALGGGFASDIGGPVEIRDSLIRDNEASSVVDAAGGGVFLAGPSNVTNTTIADNTVTAGDEALGGGIAARSTSDLSFVTLSGNEAIGPTSPNQVAALFAGTVVRFRATAIDDIDQSADACGTGDGVGGTNASGGTFSSLGANVGVGTSCGLTGSNDVQGLAPSTLGLDSLADNTGGAGGGSAFLAGAAGFKAPVQTRRPADPSPVNDRATACTDADGNTLTTDARGGGRPQGTGCDAGAHERGLIAPAVVTDTDPDSPADDETPLVKGDAPASAVTVKVFRSVFECRAGNGVEAPVAQFESTGIEVSVPMNSDSSFVAQATDFDGNRSECAGGFFYRELTPGPAAPVFTDTDPDSPADNTQPFIKGTAPAGSTVTLYEVGPAGTCSQLREVATGPASQFASPGFQVTVEDGSTTTFRAISVDGITGLESSCSTSSITYDEMGALPPPPTLTGAFLSTINRIRVVGTAPNSETVRLFAQPNCAGGVVAEDTASNFAFGDGIFVSVAENSSTTFSAIGVDRFGRASPCSSTTATYVNVPTEGPRPTLTGTSPKSPANSTNPRIRGLAPGAGTVFLYTNENCLGDPVASGTEDEFQSTGIRVRVAEGSTTTFFARGDYPGAFIFGLAPCSTSSVTYKDKSPKDPVIKPPASCPPRGCSVGVTVPGPGKVKIFDAGATRPRTGARLSRGSDALIASVVSKARRAGRLSLKVKPTRVARRLLKSRKRLKVKLGVTFTPKGGSPVTSTEQLKLVR